MHPSLMTLDLRGNPGLTDAGIRALAAEIEAAPPKQLRSVLVDDSRSQQQEESSEALHLPRETRGNGAVRAPASEFEAAAECENKAESPHPQGNPLRKATSNPNSSQPAQGVPADDGSPSAAERLRSAVLLARLPETAARVVLQVRGNSPGVVSVNCDVLLCQGGGGGEPFLVVGQTRPRPWLGGVAGAGGEGGGSISIDVPAATRQRHSGVRNVMINHIRTEGGCYCWGNGPFKANLGSYSKGVFVGQKWESRGAFERFRGRSFKCAPRR
ncbi:hypothetical protein DIPPA_16452 [Diplonema papillatum]|nr:hypothetical protein DIPPA_16452 [Diplonema papillatum]